MNRKLITIGLFFLSFIITISLIIVACTSELIVLNNSMYPVINEGDRIIVLHHIKKNNGSKVTCNFLRVIPFKRNWIYVFKSTLPNGENYLAIKRCVAKSGDIVYIGKENLICTNGALKLSESVGYISIKIDKNKLFMVGDNYSRSLDSRSYGPVDKSQIYGIYLRTKK